MFCGETIIPKGLRGSQLSFKFTIRSCLKGGQRMKKKILKRGMSGLLAVLMAFTALIGMGTTAFAASETAESYMVSYSVEIFSTTISA